MVSEYEAAKLRRDMESELNAASSTLLKCAVGILVLFVLALMSPTLGPERDFGPHTAATQATAR